MTASFDLPQIPIVGDPAPQFVMPALSGSPTFSSDKLGGKCSLFLFMGSAGHPACTEALKLVERHHALFDDRATIFMAVTIDPEDVNQGRIADKPGRHFLLDFNQALSTRHGTVTKSDGQTIINPQWVLFDPAFRVASRFPFEQGEQAIRALSELLAATSVDRQAPVLAVANVLEPEFCRALVDYYEAVGGSESGFMKAVDGKTVGVVDHSFKRRFDCFIKDDALQLALKARIERRLVPAIHRAFQFEATRIERYIVACYDGTSGGFFGAHRDNTTPGTAHRRFAVTINLNDAFDGGELRFPEFGQRTYRAAAGSATVFSCGLLHEALPVTSGLRYATLPFLYDEAAAVIRRANAASIVNVGDPTGEQLLKAQG